MKMVEEETSDLVKKLILLKFTNNDERNEYCLEVIPEIN
jgi:hypothetical protein